MRMKSMFLPVFLSSVLFGTNAYADLMNTVLTGIQDTSDPFLWTTHDGEGRRASAYFQYDDTNNLLTILLSNDSTEITNNPNESLAGLFFCFDGELTNPSVDVASGSTLYLVGSPPNNDSPTNTELSGEYGFLSDINDINGGNGNYGISNTAFDPGVGAPAGWTGFGGTIIDESIAYGPQYNTPNGAEFGIVGTAGVGHPLSKWSYVQNAVVISFDYDGPFDADSICQVNFLYGTSFEAVPEPATMFLFGTGLVGLAGISRARRKKSI
jgi:hypothetical protein